MDLFEYQGKQYFARFGIPVSAGDVLVFGGGIVPKDDLAKLAALGVAKIFTPGTPTTEIVTWVETVVRPRVEAV